MIRRIIWFWYSLAAIGLLLLVLQCQHKKNTTQQSAPESPWLNTSDSAHYVGINTCRKCHDDVYQSFKNTGMGHSFGLATKSRSAADFHLKKPLYDKYKDLYYQPFIQDTSLYVMEYRLAKKDTVYKRVEKISYIIGSGHHTNSHIINTNGYLNQAPFTWYVQAAQWDLPPGFEKGFNSRFSRELGNECLTCHNAYPTPVAGSINKYSYVPLGIDCERCHGPGSIHVQQKMAGKVIDITKDTDFTIVNPAKVPYNLQIDICQRCHLQGDAVLKDGKTFYDFHPGTPLKTVMDVFMPVYENQENGFLMASHAERLRKSHCFRSSGGNSNFKAMTCITCHNPHVSVKVTPEQYFISKCMDCHKNPHASDPQVLKTKGQNCITCHMPKSSAVDIPHVTITDHYIRVVKSNEKKTSTIGVGAFKGLSDLTDSTPDNLTRAKGYLYFYEKFEHRPQMLDSAWKYIQTFKEIAHPELYLYYYYLKENWSAAVNTIANHKNAFSDPVSNYQAAQSLINLERYADALPWLKETTAKLPYALKYRLKLGEDYLYLESFDEAQLEFNFVLKENPKLETAWNDAGFLDLLERRAPDALIKFQKALSLNPDYIPSQINIAKVYMLQGDKPKAVNQLNTVLKKNPNNQDALKLLEYLRSIK
jgi:hypothetical protein